MQVLALVLVLVMVLPPHIGLEGQDQNRRNNMHGTDDDRDVSDDDVLLLPPRLRIVRATETRLPH